MWQPIETAPKDGTRVLVFCHWGVDIAQWNQDSYIRKPKPYWSYRRSSSKGADRRFPPTHWMPLPEPPQ